MLHMVWGGIVVLVALTFTGLSIHKTAEIDTLKLDLAAAQELAAESAWQVEHCEDTPAAQ